MFIIKLFKKLFKLIIGLVVFLIILIVALFIALSNKDTSFPENDFKDEVLSEDIGSFFELSQKDYNLDFAIDSKFINNLIFRYIKDSVNTEYSPVDGQTQNAKSVISKSLPKDIFFVGGKSLEIKSVYSKIEDNKLSLVVSLNALDLLESTFSFTFNISSDDENFILNMDNFKFGKIKISKGFASKILTTILGNTEQSINDIFKLSYKDMQLLINKNELIKMLSSEDASTQVVSTILESESKNINLNIKNNSLCLSANLDSFKLSSEDLAILEELYQPFDKDLFIRNKTQGLLFNSLASENMNILLTYSDFNGIIYDSTNHYKDLSFTIDGLSDDLNKVEITGIKLYYENNNLFIKIYLKLLNIDTFISFSMNSTNSTDKEIILNVNEDFNVGNINIKNKEFVTTILEGAFTDFDLLTYDKERQAFIINEESLKKMLNINSVSMPINVDKIFLNENGFSSTLSFTDSSLHSKVNEIKDSISEVLKSDFIDPSDFVTEGDQGEIITKLNETLEDISDILNDPLGSLNEEKSQELTSIVNSLSEENKEVIIDKIEDKLSNDDLDKLYDLYNSLFK